MVYCTLNPNIHATIKLYNSITYCSFSCLLLSWYLLSFATWLISFCWHPHHPRTGCYSSHSWKLLSPKGCCRYEHAPLIHSIPFIAPHWSCVITQSPSIFKHSTYRVLICRWFFSISSGCPPPSFYHVVLSFWTLLPIQHLTHVASPHHQGRHQSIIGSCQKQSYFKLGQIPNFDWIMSESHCHFPNHSCYSSKYHSTKILFDLQHQKDLQSCFDPFLKEHQYWIVKVLWIEH